MDVSLVRLFFHRFLSNEVEELDEVTSEAMKQARPLSEPIWHRDS